MSFSRLPHGSQAEFHKVIACLASSARYHEIMSMVTVRVRATYVYMSEDHWPARRRIQGNGDTRRKVFEMGILLTAIDIVGGGVSGSS